METWQLILFIVVIVVALWIAATVIFAAIVNRRHPPIGSFTQVDGVRLHYLERGNSEGLALVLLHGNGMMMQDFLISGVLEQASPQYRVLCFDRPGFGHSERPRGRIWTPDKQADLIAAALRQLGVERAVVVGHSWGTLVAVALGLRHAELVRGLVLASGYYFPTLRKDVWFLSGPAIPVVGDLMRYTVSPVLGWLMMPKLLRKLFAPRPIPERFQRDFPISLTLRPVQLRAAAEETAFMIPWVMGMQARYTDLTCPVAAIAGEQDQVVNSDQTKRLHTMLPRSVVRSVAHAGHMVHHASPGQVVEAAGLIFAWPQVQPQVRATLQ